MTAGRIVDESIVDALCVKLSNPKTSLRDKYRVLFSLRNIAGEAARQALAEGVRLDKAAVHPVLCLPRAS
jgi:hypothetical protein